MWITLEEQERVSTKKEYFALDEELRTKLETENPRHEVTQKVNTSASTFNQLHEAAKEFAKLWRKKLSQVNFDTYVDEEYGSNFAIAEFSLLGMETDTQYHRRLINHYESAKRQEEWDRKQFERLKTKFSK